MAYEYSIRRYRNWYGKLLRFYPKPFRERFGEGMEQTFNDLCRERKEAGKGLFAFALWAFVETSAGIIRENIGGIMMQNIIRKPSAWLPIAISLVVFTSILCYVAVAIFGVAPEEGSRIFSIYFQWLTLIQVPIIVFFAIKWLPRQPKQAALILALQIIAAMISIAPIGLFEWWLDIVIMP
jgi:hypothetical protein